MSIAFYSNDTDVIKRKSSTSTVSNLIETDSLEEIFELNQCIEWIKSNNFSRVALQFPDNLLYNAASIALKLEESTGKVIFILGDTSYSSCCVDEIAAEHASADAIIHFGHACLSPTQRLPVLYIFGKSFIDIKDATLAFKLFFPDVTVPVIILFEVIYSHAIGKIAENLKDYRNLFISQLDILSKGTRLCSTEASNDNMFNIYKCQRYFAFPKSQNLNDCSIFYIGDQNQILTNFMLSFNHCKFFSYHPYKRVAQLETLDRNKFLKRRYYYIEKAKDAKIIGILVGTLGVSNYLLIIKHLRELIKAAGKKSYTLVVGKLNAAKLANFAEIEAFVNVACSESSVINCHEFYQPIITPYELEIALNQDREWTGDYIVDFSGLLPGSAMHLPPNEIKKCEADVSLITGKLRSADFCVKTEEQCNETSALITRDEMKISTIHSQAAGEYLSHRTWKGLEQHLGETPVAKVLQGKKGIACEYEDELNNHN